VAPLRLGPDSLHVGPVILANMEFPAPAAAVLIAALRLVPVVIVRPVHTQVLAPPLVLIVRPGIIVTLVVV